MVKVNNIGIKPSGCIATSALEKTCDMFSEKYPETSEELKDQSYVDDVGLGAPTIAELEQKVKEADEIFEAGGMKCKGWRFSHKARDEVEFGGELEGSELYGSTEKVLGMGWFPLPDLFKFKFRLNFGERKGKVWLEANITREQLMKNPPSMLTRRMVSTPTAGVFDPLSLLTPVLLQAKILLRKSWNHENEQLGWDDPLPNSLRLEWIEFFLLLFDIEGLEFERSLTPPPPPWASPGWSCSRTEHWCPTAPADSSAGRWKCLVSSGNGKREDCPEMLGHCASHGIMWRGNSGENGEIHSRKDQDELREGVSHCG